VKFISKPKRLSRPIGIRYLNGPFHSHRVFSSVFFHIDTL